DPPLPFEPLDGLSNVRPHHGEHHDVRRCRVPYRPGGHAVAEILHEFGERFRPTAVGDHDLPARTTRDLRHRPTDPPSTDDPDVLDIRWLHHGPFSNADANR